LPALLLLLLQFLVQARLCPECPLIEVIFIVVLRRKDPDQVNQKTALNLHNMREQRRDKMTLAKEAVFTEDSNRRSDAVACRKKTTPYATIDFHHQVSLAGVHLHQVKESGLGNRVTMQMYSNSLKVNRVCKACSPDSVMYKSKRSSSYSPVMSVKGKQEMSPTGGKEGKVVVVKQGHLLKA
jgi:hypothetical protein